VSVPPPEPYDPAADRFLMQPEDMTPSPVRPEDVANARLLPNGNIAVTGPGGTAVLPQGTPAWTRYAAAMLAVYQSGERGDSP
jgi:hypothetical protein